MHIYVKTNQSTYSILTNVSVINTRYKIQDTRFFISGKLPIVHDYTMFNKMIVT